LLYKQSQWGAECKRNLTTDITIWRIILLRIKRVLHWMIKLADSCTTRNRFLYADFVGQYNQPYAIPLSQWLDEVYNAALKNK